MENLNVVLTLLGVLSMGSCAIHYVSSKRASAKVLVETDGGSSTK